MDPPSSLSQPLEEPGVPLRRRLHLVFHGQAPGMLLHLCRGKRHAEGFHIIDQIWTLRIQNGDHGRYLTDLPQHGHRDPHAIDGCLEYQDGLIGCQPSRMILEELSRDSEPRSPHPDPTEEDTDGSGRKGRCRS